MRGVVLGLAAVVVGLARPGQDVGPKLESFVTTDKYAYYVAPPRLVTMGEVDSVFFTPEGRYGLISGHDSQRKSAAGILGELTDPSTAPEPKKWIKVWDTRNDIVRDASPQIMKIMDGIGPEGSLEWTSKPGTAILQLNAPVPGAKAVEVSIHRLDFSDGSVTRVIDVKTEGDLGPVVMVSPKRPLIVLVARTTNKPIDRRDLKTTLSFTSFDLNGRPLKSGSSTVPGWAHIDEWTADGADLLGKAVKLGAPGQSGKAETMVLNLTTGIVSVTKEDIKGYLADTPEPELQATVSESVTRNGEKTAAVKSLWLSSKPDAEIPSCLVASDVSDQCTLSPGLDFVTYVSHGRLFVSDIVKMDLDEFKMVKAAAEKRDAMSRAKQAALGMLIYASDCDDFMPLHDGFEDAVYPYLKNRGILDGFVYTYKGGSLTSLKDPANTEIGYISVSGGRAVAYADGHVKFDGGQG